MLTVFPTLVRRPTLSKMSTRALKSPWSQAVFYADNGMVVSSDPAWLQGAFSALVAIFDRVVLLTNVRKTVSTVCHPCRAGGRNRTEEAYSRRVTGVGKSCAERQRERVVCEECGEVIAVGSMSSHLMTRHGMDAARRHL